MLGIIGAMEEEVDRLKAEMERVTVRQKASMEFFQGRIQGKRLLLSVPGSVRSMRESVPRYWWMITR